MTHVGEKLVIMDNATTTFRNKKRISLSQNFALFLIFLFIVCLLGTGLLVYHFSSCSAASCSINPSSLSNQISCNSTVSEAVSIEDVTTTTATETSTLDLDLTISENKTKSVNLRLDNRIIPHSYKLKLLPFIFETNFTFHGEVTILVNVTGRTQSITLHADQLDIESDYIQVYREGDDYAQIDVLELTNDTKSDFFTINLAEELNEGVQYNIYIKFKGVLNDLMEGFYRSSYQDGNETRWLAATQFQPTDARKAFPCFDEPALKAKFQVSLGRLKTMTSISNLPKVRQSEEVDGLDGYVWDHFQETVPMSTYLLAFVVSDFEHLTHGNFSVWARRSAISQARYGLDIGPQILQFYEKFFNIAFPLPKIDMVALPDFSSGAMENWGLITFRESLLLHQDGVSSRLYLPIIGGVIAHELAHQWFGNLVTPSWWSDLWLNEGFATYLEYIAMNAVRPEWRLLDQFVTSELQAVFSMDSLQTSHRISAEVEDTDEIQDIFDQISYSKAATIIRMMDAFLTTEVFKKGITNFLNERKYGSANQDDLWETLTKQAHESGVLRETITVKQIMDTWTLQTGYPVVNVSRNYELNNVIMTQQRFFLRYKQSDPEASKWWIPITYQSKQSTTNSFWMQPFEDIVTYSAPGNSNDWLLVNINQTGFYRVNYDLKNWEMLTEQLLNDHTVFDPKNRAQMLDDSMNLAAAGHLNYDVALNVTKYLTKETDLVPWKSAVSSFEYLNDMFVRTAHFDKLKAHVTHLLSNLYKTVGFNDSPGDELLTVSKRSLVLKWACQLGVTDCIIHANRQFETWRNSPDPDNYNTISPDLRQTIYCTAIRDGGQEHWDFVWNRVLRSNVSTERVMMMIALGCSRETWILSRYLEWSVTESSGIRKQDLVTVFNAVTNNVVGQELAYRFLKNNWKRLKQYLGASSVMLTGVVSACTNNLNSRQEVEDLRRFIHEQSLDQGVTFRTVKQAIEQAEANVQWMEFNFEKIVEWLSRQPN